MTKTGALGKIEHRALLQTDKAVSHTTRKGGEAMRITLHIGAFTVTIIVKRRNRHPGR